VEEEEEGGGEDGGGGGRGSRRGGEEEKEAAGGGGGGGGRGACASNPCFLCAAAALSVSEALTCSRGAHVGASPAPPRSLASRNLGCGGGGTPPKGLCPPAEPPTPCIPRVCDCALFFSALRRASGAWRPGGGAKREACGVRRAYSVLGST
jgi:hypothetical protein